MRSQRCIVNLFLFVNCKMWRWILPLLVLNVISLTTLKEPENFRALKELYTVFLANVPSQFPELRRRSIILGFQGDGTEIGYNVNKGYEIGVCLDGTPNQMFHVLLHELAHTTVKSFDHNEEFWKNLKELKEHCKGLGIYEEITTQTYIMVCEFG
jgi:hypothetical protein